MEKRLESISLSDFLIWEQRQEHKHELLQGQILAFSGGSLDHDDIIANVHFALRSQLLPPCKAYGSNVITETVTRKGINGFRADVVVTCSEENSGKALSVKHPRILVEVLSPSNLGQRWAAKLFEYWNTPSLEQFVTIDSNERSVESFVRDEHGLWQSAIALIGDGILKFPSVQVEIELGKIYRGTSLDDNA